MTSNRDILLEYGPLSSNPLVNEREIDNIHQIINKNQKNIFLRSDLELNNNENIMPAKVFKVFIDKLENYWIIGSDTIDQISPNENWIKFLIDSPLFY
jgi:nicotinic acid mononucleotide adenylyltransferase